MRILHLHSGNLYGGVETLLRTMARCGKLAPDLQQVFALCFEDRVAAELRAAGAELRMLNPVHASHPFSILRARKKIAELCRGAHFDATVVHSAWSLALLAPAATRPIILVQHDLASGRHWTERWSRHTRPDMVIANSDFTARRVSSVQPGVPVITIHPPVELKSPRRPASVRQELRDRWKTPAGATVILQAARFEPWKGHRLLLDSLGTLRSELNWVLWIAGAPQRPLESQLRDDLQLRARDLGIEDRVTFLGHIGDMPGAMQAAGIYCQPNTAPEPFGLAFIEALDAGLPIVTTALGGASEILSPGCGLLAQPSVESVANALRQVLASPALRTCLGQSGPSRARTLCDPGAQMGAFVAAIDMCRTSRLAA